MPSLYEILLPLISARYPHEHAKVKFWKDSNILIFPANSDLSMTWRPPQGKIYIVYALTFGKPRDYNTGDIIITNEFGFYHRHDPQMIWHWDPAVESVFDVEQYPLYLEVERGTPMDFYFYNNTSYKIIWDFSVWLLEAKIEDLDFIRSYIRDYIEQFRELRRLREEIERMNRFLSTLAPAPPPTRIEVERKREEVEREFDPHKLRRV